MSPTPRVRLHAQICLAAVSLIVASCSNSESRASGHAAAAEPAPGVNASAVQTQPLDADPCGWLTRVEVERLIGPLGAEPTRVNDAEQFDTPNPRGSACRYQLQAHSDNNEAFIAVGVVLDGGSAIEAGLGATFTEMGVAALGGADRADTSSSRWDWMSNLPSDALKAARQGHIAIMTSVRAPSLRGERVDSLAAAIVDRIPDLPFGERGGAAHDSSADPCALLTRAEAEAVLGKLVVPPYRSRESTPFANGNGTSCSFYTARHHVLVLTPTRRDGRVVFQAMSGMNQNISGQLALNAVDDTLDGPWDQTALSMDGTLYFLKGDQMLEMRYRTSSTDLTGALRLAAAALARL